MQKELDANYPELDVQLMGINAYDQQAGNALATDGRDIPLLQDVDANGDRRSDVWENSWGADYRDVVILDDENVRVGVFNLTEHDLGNPENYATLRQMLIDTAMSSQEPELAAGDANGDYRFDQLDLFQVLRAGKFETGQPASWEQGDWNGDGVFDRSDVLAALQTGNYLRENYAAKGSVLTDDTGLLAKSDQPAYVLSEAVVDTLFATPDPP